MRENKVNHYNNISLFRNSLKVDSLLNQQSAKRKSDLSFCVESILERSNLK